MRLYRVLAPIDWLLVAALVPLLAAGVVTMTSFTGQNYFASRQLVWLLIAVTFFFVASFLDWRLLRKSWVVVSIYLLSLALLSITLLLSPVRGSRSWLELGAASFQPADFAKLALILMLAKYFTKRHVEIAHIRHILVSGVYAFLPFVLVFRQPDLGSAVVFFLIWFGMIMVSGVSKKHLLGLLAVVVIVFSLLWGFVLRPYQKDRVLTFLHPLADIRGAGYNAFQSQIAVGSGQLVGQGFGYGTQSRLEFLPEYETDFIFAAYAEEWGFMGVVIFFLLFAIVIWRVLSAALVGATNFERLYCLGVAIFLMSHFIINVGMNIGLLPVTGLTLPFVSYGGSHLVVEFLALGIVMGQRRYARATHPEDATREFLGPK